MSTPQLNTTDRQILKQLQGLTDNEILRGKDENQVPFLEHLFRIHEVAFGTTCSNCPSALPGYIAKIRNLNNKKMSKKSKDQKFMLKDNVILTVPGTSQAFSSHNITDEEAIKQLKLNPNKKALFSRLPDNVDELIGVTQDEVVKIGEVEFTIDAAKELLGKIGVTSNATTARGVNSKIKSLNEDQTNQLNELVNSLEEE